MREASLLLAQHDGGDGALADTQPVDGGLVPVYSTTIWPAWLEASAA